MGQEKRQVFLIVTSDKERSNRYGEALTRTFTHSTIFHAADSFEAKYKLANANPRVIIIDEDLQGESGLELVKKILKDKGNKHTYLVIVSPIADHDQFTEEVESGRVQFLTEPDRETALIDCVSNVLLPQTFPGLQKQYEIVNLKPDDFLFKEGDKTEVAYIVKKGRLRAFSICTSGEKIMLGEIVAGEFVGEMGHFTHGARSASVQATTEVELIAIPNDILDQVVFTRPSWAKALVKTLSHRLKKANRALTG